MGRLLILMLVCAGGLAAHGQEFAFDLPRTREARLFTDAPPPADVPDIYRTGQLLDDSGPPSSELKYGLGASLALVDNPVGFGSNGWFDYYPFTFLAFGVNTFFNYGVITRDRLDGGTAFSTGFTAGGKFVLDFPELELTRWFRPYAMFHPLGLMYFAGSEDFRDSDGNRDTFRYSDVFFMMQGGAGVDFFLTSELAVGAGFFWRSTYGGSRHTSSGVRVRHRGRTDLNLEYIRLTYRF
jgi:hypothetical protein